MRCVWAVMLEIDELEWNGRKGTQRTQRVEFLNGFQRRKGEGICEC
jgi:hypothetical protein